MRLILHITHITLLVVLCLTGVFASLVLLQQHLYPGAGHEWTDATCGENNAGDKSNCEEVVHSRWGKILGIPTAFWGLFYFSALMFWFLFIGRPSIEKRYWHFLPLAATALGMIASVLFVAIMYTSLEQRCPWCMVTHVVNLLILLLTLALWPRRPAPAKARAQDAVAVPRRPSRVQHPPTRLVLAVVLLAILVGIGAAQSIAMSNLWVTNETLKAVAQVTHQLFQNEQHVSEIQLRSDDPQKKASDNRLHVQAVVFSDFECGHCQQLATAMEKEYNLLFDNHLHVVFKHFPLCSDCNPNVKTRYNVHACRAAHAAEAARMQGGNDVFWKAHDVLFESARLESLGEIDYRQLAEELSLDPDRFCADMESEETARRIQEDIELGRSLGVDNTPAVFVSGQRVPVMVAMRPDFWEAVARVYTTKVREPETDKIQPIPAPEEGRTVSQPLARRQNPYESSSGQVALSAPLSDKRPRDSSGE